MNKRFSTLLTMVLLMVGALFNSASATKTLEAITGDAKLQNGVKFYLGQSTNYLKASAAITFTSGDLKDVTGVTFAKATSVDDASVFEVSDYKFENGNSIFSLKVDGQYVYSQASAVAAAGDKNEGATIVATNKFMMKGDKIASANLYANLAGAAAVGVDGSSVDYTGNAVTPLYESGAAVAAKDLNDYNKNGISFNFAAKTDLFEANIFGQPMLAVEAAGTTTLNMLATGKIYFLVGTKEKLDAVRALLDGTTGKLKDEAASVTAIKADGIKVVSLKEGKKYTIANAQAGEGLQLVLEKGADVFASANAAKNAAFGVTELDKTNNPGYYQLAITPHTDVMGSPAELYVGAIQFTSTDAKSYITTVVAANKGKLALATLGANSYIDASALLKSKAMNVVNIYFTSGVPSTSEEQGNANNTEYHKYLVAGAVSNAFALQALPADKLDGFSSPMSQWVVTGFDGKYTFTFTNREASGVVNNLTLALQPTKVAGEFEIIGSNLGSVNISNIYASDGADRQLIGKTVKFNTIAATNPYLDLTADQMKAPISLSFSGKDATFGEKTFYGAFDDINNPTTYTPSVKEAVANFTFEKVKKAANPDKNKVNYIQNILTYAYLDGTTVKTAKDTLFVPSYKLKVADDLYMKNDASLADAENAGEFVFRAYGDNKYVMAKADNTVGAATYAGTIVTTVNQAVSIKDTKDAFAVAGTLFAPSDAAFQYVSLNIADNSDKTTLPAVARHASFDNALGSVSMQDAKGINEGILNAEGLIFWLDTADSKAVTPSFYISRGVEGQAERLFMYNAADSLKNFNEGGAIQKPNEAYELEGTGNAKAIFRAATIAAVDTIATTVDGKAAIVAEEEDKAENVLGGLDNFKFGICLADEGVEGEYVIYSKGDNSYLYSLNGKLGFIADAKQALVVTLGTETPTANDAIEASTITVLAKDGAIEVIGAAGKKVVVSNILGQVIANTVIASDNATIAAPAGVVVVAVEGEAAVKAIVK